jgi:hypothetical protein
MSHECIKGEFVFFCCFSTAGLMLPVSSFLLTPLEFYGIQLQHLSLHSFVLVVIFIHFCEMFVIMQSSVPLFLAVPRAALSREGDKSNRPLLLTALSQWIGCICHGCRSWQVGPLKEGLGNHAANPQNRQVLPTGAPTCNRDHWEEPLRL